MVIKKGIKITKNWSSTSSSSSSYIINSCSALLLKPYQKTRLNMPRNRGNGGGSGGNGGSYYSVRYGRNPGIYSSW